MFLHLRKKYKLLLCSRTNSFGVASAITHRASIIVVLYALVSKAYLCLDCLLWYAFILYAHPGCCICDYWNFKYIFVQGVSKLFVKTLTARFCTFGSVEICLKNNI